MKSKVHGWFLWFTKILDLVPSFPKVHGWSLWFAFCNAFSPQLCQKYMDGPYGLHFVTHSVPNFAKSTWTIHVLNGLGTKCITKCKPQGPSVRS
ncbi:hypothetical protein HanIR_Chr12g0587391 [Helianthus annuus]|nr:hypothetical protein HanIR_Chr12g0587391 [Helianthus annuus]